MWLNTVLTYMWYNLHHVCMDRNLNVGVRVGLCLHWMYSDAVYSRSLTLKTMVTSVELCTVIPVSLSLNYFHGLESEKKVYVLQFWMWITWVFALLFIILKKSICYYFIIILVTTSVTDLLSLSVCLSLCLLRSLSFLILLGGKGNIHKKILKNDWINDWSQAALHAG